MHLQAWVLVFSTYSRSELRNYSYVLIRTDENENDGIKSARAVAATKSLKREEIKERT